jgi:ketosteroid isomerase-like protein
MGADMGTKTALLPNAIVALARAAGILQAMSPENVELVRAAWEAWERGDIEALFGFYDPAIVWDQTGYAGMELSSVYHGHDGVKQFFRDWLAPFESYYAHAEDFIDAGEAVVVRCRQGGRGKQSGRGGGDAPLLAGLPPSRWSRRPKLSTLWGCGNRRCRGRTWRWCGGPMPL